MGDPADPELTALRAQIRRAGGPVYATYPSINALSVLLPAEQVRAIARRDDVRSVSPNRETKQTASVLEAAAATPSSKVRECSANGVYTGLDGTGIAILDSGLMVNHRNLANAAGTSRVVKSADMLKSTTSRAQCAGGVNPSSSLQPGSSALAGYENLTSSTDALTADPHSHGTHVASIAAGRGLYQSPDSTAVAPNANLIDVRVPDAKGRRRSCAAAASSSRSANSNGSAGWPARTAGSGPG